MSSGDSDYVLVEAEAKKVAQSAARALRESRRQCLEGGWGRVTWTGQHGGTKQPRCVYVGGRCVCVCVCGCVCGCGCGCVCVWCVCVGGVWEGVCVGGGCVCACVGCVCVCVCVVCVGGCVDVGVWMCVCVYVGRVGQGYLDGAARRNKTAEVCVFVCVCTCLFVCVFVCVCR